MRITKDYVFFWGGEFSNFHPAKFKFCELEFETSEKCFMFEKAVFFNDVETARLILQTTEPKEAKKLGRKVKNFDEKEWSTARFNIMFNICLEKFYQNEGLRKKLLETGNKILVEASPYDTVWGIGMSSDHPLVEFEEHWNGQNLLGKVLMEVREKIRMETINDK